MQSLQALGYYHAGLSWQGDCLMNLQPGPPVRLGTVQVLINGEAAQDAAFVELLTHYPLKTGAIFDQGTYDSLKSGIEALARAHGYFDGRWQHHLIELNVQQNRADVHLVYDSGRRYRLGAVEFLHTPVRLKILRRFVPFQPGTPYDADRLMQLNKNLLDTHYFKSVDVQAEPKQAVNHVIPVRVRLSVGKRNNMALGVGFATDIGPRLSANWSRPLLSQNGHSVSVDTQYSRIQSSVQFSYNIPVETTREDTMQVIYGFQRYVILNTVTDSTLFGPQYNLFAANGWREVSYIHWQRNFYSRTDGSTATSNLLLPGFSWTRTISRGGVDPYEGNQQTWQIEGGTNDLLSDTNVLDVHANWRWLQTYLGRHQLLVRFDGGGLWASDWTKIPPTMRFFAGGDQSIRGYGFNSLGPTDNLGNVLGGHYLLVGSLQYGYQWRPHWRPHVFVDAGNAYDSLRDEPTKKSTGFGVSWLSPVGPVSVDLGFGLRDATHPVRLHFYMGPPL